jgi:acetyltransferase-like isoleucine patch superfamily enzyme
MMITAFVGIFPGNHQTNDATRPMRQQGMFTRGGAMIEDEAWIGPHSVVLHGVREGRARIIAAGAIVSKDVEPYSAMARVPAREILSRLTGVIQD